MQIRDNEKTQDKKQTTELSMTKLKETTLDDQIEIILKYVGPRRKFVQGIVLQVVKCEIMKFVGPRRKFVQGIDVSKVD